MAIPLDVFPERGWVGYGGVLPDGSVSCWRNQIKREGKFVSVRTNLASSLVQRKISPLQIWQKRNTEIAGLLIVIYQAVCLRLTNSHHPANNADS